MLKRILIIIGISIFIWGCKSTAGIEFRKDDKNEMIAVRNPWLKPYLEIANVRETKVGDFMKVNVTVFSKYEKDLNLQYKFTWYDTNGFVLDGDDMPWIPVRLYGFQSDDFSHSAKNPNATQFKIIFRETN